MGGLGSERSGRRGRGVEIWIAGLTSKRIIAGEERSLGTTQHVGDRRGHLIPNATIDWCPRSLGLGRRVDRGIHWLSKGISGVLGVAVGGWVSVVG